MTNSRLQINEFRLADEWKRRRSERIFLSDAVPFVATAPAYQMTKIFRTPSRDSTSRAHVAAVSSLVSGQGAAAAGHRRVGGELNGIETVAPPGGGSTDCTTYIRAPFDEAVMTTDSRTIVKTSATSDDTRPVTVAVVRSDATAAVGSKLDGIDPIDPTRGGLAKTIATESKETSKSCSKQPGKLVGITRS